MSSYGISTYLRDQWLGSVAGTPFSVSAVYEQLHTAFPTTTGLVGVSAIADVELATYTPISGVLTLTGFPSWIGDINEDIVAHSVWDGPVPATAHLLWIAPIAPGELIAQGDAVTLTAATLPFLYGLMSN